MWRVVGQLALIAAALPVAAQDEADPVGVPEPDPMAIAAAAVEFLAAQDAFTFRWFASFDEVIDGREKLTFLRSGVNTMVRGVGFVSHTERGDAYRDYYYDGAVFTVASPDENFYASVEFAGGFDALIEAVRERTGNVVPLWSMMSETLPARFLESVDGAAYVGTTRIAGEPAHHLAFTSYDEDWQIWVAADPERPLPLLIVGTDPYQQGWPQYRAYLTGWDLSPPTDPDQFVFVPEEDDLPVSLPDLETAEPPEPRGARSPETAEPGEAAAEGTGAEATPEPAE